MLKKPVRITIQIPAATFERLERGEEDSMARIVRQTLEIGLTEMERKKKGDLITIDVR